MRLINTTYFLFFGCKSSVLLDIWLQKNKDEITLKACLPQRFSEVHQLIKSTPFQEENSRDSINRAFGFVGGKSGVQGVHPPEELNKGVHTVR